MKKIKLTAVLLAVITVSLFTVLLCTTALAADEADGTQATATITAEENKSAAVYTEENSENSLKKTKAIAAGAVVAIVATAGAIGMAMSIRKSTESMARQPEAADKINSAMMLGLVFIETAIIYALIVAILVIFVL